ncbi:MAG: Crp/Fnr family transcriptional regulator [Candidatus Krumholzibacteria bacterium]|jgi:CRP/FNR family transcriptional regulator|nr:Crp/Fnr family transcriptional regulator [Candidatus Krumholzibacteria bacterium]MDP6669147.1 Crp/Fnr family transcriptional regulator [Candidatus Krumholzibacteria bacterium]MDP6797548.1 Crp/Fnr family transcriptional regulator [Candidatus Krumholzibacteria bacterium]MDP7021307.1 Crp/Fnr family transcriptional regulator [Candidatus Krumholzibacteria bacterium]
MSILIELKASPFFQELSQDFLEKVIEIASKQKHGKGESVFHAGDEVMGFYIVSQGMVKVSVSGSSGREQVLHFIRKGESFGEAAALGHRQWPVNAVAMEDCRLIHVPAAPFLRLLCENPTFSRQVLFSMARKLIEFRRIIEDLSIREVRARLALWLLRERERHGDSDEIELPVGKGELARLLGTTAESLSRSLRILSEQGLIQVDGKRIRVLDESGLRELALE